MKPEDKVTADRLTAAGKTQTPLTEDDTKTTAQATPLTAELLAKRLEALAGDHPPSGWILNAALLLRIQSDAIRRIQAREEAQALREAELVKALAGLVGSYEWLCSTFECSKSGAYHDAVRLLDLTAPPTNSKEMNK